MKATFVARLLRGIIGGVILYLIALTEFLLLKIDCPTEIFNVSIIALFLIGIVLTAFIVLHKNRTTGQTITSACIQIVSYLCFLVINGYLGTIRWLVQILNLANSPLTGNAFGVLLLLFTCTIVTVSIITIIIPPITLRVSKLFGKDR